MINLKNYNITLFGDSVPAGIVYEKNKLHRLQKSCVDLVCKHFGIKVTNISKYGQTWTRLIEKGMIENYINKAKKSENNVAVFFMGGNDSDYEWTKVAESPLTYHPEKTPIDNFKVMLGSTIKELQANDIKVMFCDLTPVVSNQYVDTVISKLADKTKVMEFLHNDIDNVFRHQALYSSFITQYAELNKCTMINVREHFLKNKNYGKYLCSDGIHPNKAGHKLIAKAAIKQITQKLKTQKAKNEIKLSSLCEQTQVV